MLELRVIGPVLNGSGPELHGLVQISCLQVTEQ